MDAGGGGGARSHGADRSARGADWPLATVHSLQNFQYFEYKHIV